MRTRYFMLAFLASARGAKGPQKPEGNPQGGHYGVLTFGDTLLSAEVRAFQSKEALPSSFLGPNMVKWLTGCGTKRGWQDPVECDVRAYFYAQEHSTVVRHEYKQGLLDAESAEQSWRTKGTERRPADLKTQVEEYFKFDHQYLGQRLSKEKSLVAIYVGREDILTIGNTASDLASFYDMVIDSIYDHAIEPLHTKGGYKNFMLMTLIPSYKDKDLVAWPLNALLEGKVEQWNEILQQKVENAHDGWNKRVKDGNVFVFDSHKRFLEVLQGEDEDITFKVQDEFCYIGDTQRRQEKCLKKPQDCHEFSEQKPCSTLSHYVWVDGISDSPHSAMHYALAKGATEEMKRTLGDGFWDGKWPLAKGLSNTARVSRWSGKDYFTKFFL